jgi:hypothetical protein
MHVLLNLGWAAVFIVVAAGVGIALILASTWIVPKLIDRFTPNIDEEKEIAVGNRAVAEYFGRIVAATITGISVVIAAAIVGGIAFALF